MNWAVLGLVLERPSYGYELSQRLERRYSGVLDPPISQIYAALNALERAELIEPLPVQEAPSEDPPTARRQPKVHYRATASGERAFRDWVAEGMRDDPRHVELMRRLAGAAAAIGPDTVQVMRELIDVYERACLDEASRLPLPPARGDVPAAAAGELVERLVLAAQRGRLDAHLSWIEYARREIDAFEASQAGRPGRSDGSAGA